VNGLDVFDPLNPNNLLDVITAGLVAEFSNWLIPEAAVYGSIDASMLEAELTALGQDTSKIDLHSLANKMNSSIPGNPLLDWIGVNYYTRH
jgi:beta-glucosidase/6-phospho-beta-glucosidase/beta-galactosidase